MHLALIKTLFPILWDIVTVKVKLLKGQILSWSKLTKNQRTKYSIFLICELTFVHQYLEQLLYAYRNLSDEIHETKNDA